MATKNTQRALWEKHLPKMWTRWDSRKNCEVAPKPHELELIYDIAENLGLDPMLGDLVPLQGRPYITVAGLYKIANRDNLLAGVDTSEAEYTDPDGRGERWIVKVVMYKAGVDRPFVVVADQLEYQNPQSGTWTKSPRRMTTKCGEALDLRMMLNIGIPSVEEMGYDEYSGTMAHEAREEAAVEQKTEQGEQKAKEAAEKKQTRKAEKAAEKDERQTQQQIELIGALYKKMGLPRTGEDNSLDLFHRHFADVSAEHMLTKAQSNVYIRALWGEYAERLAKAYGVPAQMLNQIRAKTGATAWSEVLDEQWPATISDIKWAGVLCLSKAAGMSEQQIDAAFVSRFPDAKSRSDVTEEALDSYIASLLKDAQNQKPGGKESTPEAAPQQESVPAEQPALI